MTDNMQEARERFYEILERSRSDSRYRDECETDPQRMIAAAGLNCSDVDSTMAEIGRRLTMPNEIQATRRILDEIADRARREPEYREWLEDEPEVALNRSGLSVSDAGTIAEEMRQNIRGATPFLRCQFTCCRHPATDWSCDPSVYV